MSAYNLNVFESVGSGVARGLSALFEPWPRAAVEELFFHARGEGEGVKLAPMNLHFIQSGARDEN